VIDAGRRARGIRDPRVDDEVPELAEVPADQIDDVDTHVAHRAVAGLGSVLSP